MAIAQRPLPGVMSRTSARTIPAPQARPRAQVRARRRVAHRPLIASIGAAVVLAATLLAYVAGHAQMTAVNYQRVRLVRQMQSLQAQQQQLKAELIKRRNRDAVEAWAKANGMVRAEGAQMVLGRSRGGW